MTLVERLLEIAERLAREDARSAASKRRAVSIAYYALFHSLAKLCADVLVGAARWETEEYKRVYRALDQLVGKAKISVGDIRRLDDRERLLLATCLLFKDRPQ